MQYEIKREDETLDEIVYNYYGASFGYLELTLNNNPILADEDIFLSKGLIITLVEKQEEAKERSKLW